VFSTRAFRDGIGEILAALPDRTYAYRPDSEFQPGETPVVVGKYNDGLTDQIVLKDYVVDDDVSQSDSTIGVQFTFIGDPNMVFVDQAKDDVFDLFHGLQATTIGGVRVIKAKRRSGVPLGQEGGRVSETANYYFDVHRPSPNRT